MWISPRERLLTKIGLDKTSSLISSYGRSWFSNSKYFWQCYKLVENLEITYLLLCFRNLKSINFPTINFFIPLKQSRSN